MSLTPSRRTADAANLRNTVRAGEPFMCQLEAGETMRIVDLHGNQAVDTLFFNADDTAERYCAVTTMRAQRNLYLTMGSVLYSNRGNAMLEVVADTCGRHDTLGGACAAESNQVRYALDRKFMHSCRDNFLLAMANWRPHALCKRDLAPNVNFFMNVPVTPAGKLTFEDGISDAGKYVELTARMSLLVLISNCPQLNNPCNAYNPTPIEIVRWAP